ncbi:MAG: hypothetical protein ABR550_05230 [Wenzhouxiangellaceae bacterium]
MPQRSLIIILSALLGMGLADRSRADYGPGRMLTSSLMAWHLTGLELGPWEAYLAHRLTPELPSVEPVGQPSISWLQIDQDIVLPDFAIPLVHNRTGSKLSFLSGHFVDAVQFGVLPGDSNKGSAGFSRSVLFSGVSRQLDSRNRISVSAVLASQEFSHSMLDVTSFNGDFPPPVDFFAFDRELSQGAGVHFGFASELAPVLMMNASFQSRISMTELANIRGVHGFSADLDIPSRLKMGLDVRAGKSALFKFAVSQVFYSEVGAFPSRSLPARFNALLGDSTSPRFDWNDLTVYSFGLRWQHEDDLELQLDFHTRSQPKPSSAVLANAISDELAQHSVVVGLGKGISERARLDIVASYAPPEFAFGGNVMGIVSNRLDQAVEVAARLNIRF